MAIDWICTRGIFRMVGKMELCVKPNSALSVYLSIRCEPVLKNCGLAAVLRNNEAR